MLFRNVVGQTALKNKLKQMVAQRRLSHALLLTGQEGYGPLPLALALAQYLLCETVYKALDATTQLDATVLSLPDDACGACPACKKNERLIHPDVQFTYPIASSKANSQNLSADYLKDWRTWVEKNSYATTFEWLQHIEAGNKQGNISANECAKILEHATLKSYEGGYKIHIIWQAQYLGKEGNKLLKLLEEPPPNSIFILIAPSVQHILPTILSRALLLRVPPISTEDLTNRLLQNSATHLSPTEAATLAMYSEGNYNETQHPLHATTAPWQPLLRAWLNAILKFGPIAQLKWIDEVAALGRENQKQFLIFFNYILATSVRQAVLGNELLRADEPLTDLLRRFQKLTNFKQQQSLVQLFDKAIYAIEGNVNAKILFLYLTIQINHILVVRKRMAEEPLPH